MEEKTKTMRDDLSSYVGTEIGVLDENGKEYKKVIITAIKEVGDTFVATGDDGVMYSEDELNISYTLTPKGIFYGVLIETGILDEHNYSEQCVNDAYELFMQRMVEFGYLVDKKEE